MKCKNGFIFQNDVCKSCAAVNALCKDGIFVSCLSGFYLKDGVCVTCSGIDNVDCSSGELKC